MNTKGLVCLVVFLGITLPQLYKTWHWREEHLELFDLSTALQKNNTDFYAWLGVEVSLFSCIYCLMSIYFLI